MTLTFYNLDYAMRELEEQFRVYEPTFHFDYQNRKLKMQISAWKIHGEDSKPLDWDRNEAVQLAREIGSFLKEFWDILEGAKPVQITGAEGYFGYIFTFPIPPWINVYQVQDDQGEFPFLVSGPAAHLEELAVKLEEYRRYEMVFWGRQILEALGFDEENDEDVTRTNEFNEQLSSIIAQFVAQELGIWYSTKGYDPEIRNVIETTN